MPNALRNAAESTAHAISDLVDEARDRIDDLPPLGRIRRRRNNKRWMLIVIAGVLGLLVVVASRRHRHETAEETSSPGARLAEKSLAVS